MAIVGFRRTVHIGHSRCLSEHCVTTVGVGTSCALCESGNDKRSYYSL